MEIKHHIITIIILTSFILLFFLKKYIKSRKRIFLFVSVFLTCYFILLLSVFIVDYIDQLELMSYDIDNDGIFELNEQNDRQKELLYKNDLGVNLSPFFALFPSLMITLIFIIIHKIILKIISAKCF